MMYLMYNFQFLIFVATIGIPRSSLTASKQQKPSRNFVKHCSYNSNNSGPKSLNKVYNANTNFLSPQHFVAQYYKSKDYTILFSIVIENHSRFSMINAKFRECEDNKINVHNLRNIDGVNSDIVVVHNGDKSGQGVCGAISWDVDEFHPKQEIQVSFNIPWRGACTTKPKSRENRYAVSIAPVMSSGDGTAFDPQLYGETNCIEDVDGNIRVDSQILPLDEPNEKGNKGSNCAPVLTLRVFDISKTNYNTYYIPIAVTLVTGSIAILTGFICMKRCKQRKESNRRKWIAKEPEARPKQVTAVTQTDDVKDINLLYTSKHQKSVIDATNDQIEIAQVYMSVTSYEMVYMSQTSRDLIQNYQPSVPMPFMNQITENSKEAITEQISSELDTVGEKGESKCGSEIGSIVWHDALEHNDVL